MLKDITEPLDMAALAARANHDRKCITEARTLTAVALAEHTHRRYPDHYQYRGSRSHWLTYEVGNDAAMPDAYTDGAEDEEPSIGVRTGYLSEKQNRTGVRRAGSALDPYWIPTGQPARINIEIAGTVARFDKSPKEVAHIRSRGLANMVPPHEHGLWTNAGTAVAERAVNTESEMKNLLRVFMSNNGWPLERFIAKGKQEFHIGDGTVAVVTPVSAGRTLDFKRLYTDDPELYAIAVDKRFIEHAPGEPARVRVKGIGTGSLTLGR